MFNPLNFISKFIKSSNQKELDRIGKIVKKINSIENEFKIQIEQTHQMKPNLLFSVAKLDSASNNT